MIYLDNHATTPVDKEVLEHMLPFFSDHFGNAHSNDHALGWYAEAAVNEARAQVAGLINAGSDEIIFTSGATESNNLALLGIMGGRPAGKYHVITTSIEHKCVLEIMKHLGDTGIRVTHLPVDEAGYINLDDLARAIQPETFLVSVMHANNEIGVVNDLESIGAICKKYNVLLHTDAAQSLGKVTIDVERYGIDLLSGSGHKIYGPKGVGFLYCRNTLQLAPVLLGGGQEEGLRPGTLNVPGIAGLGKACELAARDFNSNRKHYLHMRDRLYAALDQSFSSFVLNGPAIVPGSNSNGRLPNNLHCSFTGHRSKDIIRGLKHIAVSSGSACSSRSFEASHVLKAIGIADSRISSSIRIGIGLKNNETEIEQLVTALKHIVR